MSRYTGPVCRLCRRETATSKTGEKVKLFLKGDRCLSKKCAVERRGTAPGQKTQGKTRQKISEYGRQLREKQKMRRYYGVIEAQFENYFREAARVPGQTGKTFLQLLERRFDNVIYRLNLASSRKQARQIITHRHFRINGRICNIPSAILKPGDVITIGERSMKSTLIAANLESAKGARVPDWLVFDEQSLSAKINAVPAREHIDTPVDEQLIVQFYSR